MRRREKIHRPTKKRLKLDSFYDNTIVGRSTTYKACFPFLARGNCAIRARNPDAEEAEATTRGHSRNWPLLGETKHIALLRSRWRFPSRSLFRAFSRNVVAFTTNGCLMSGSTKIRTLFPPSVNPHRRW